MSKIAFLFSGQGAQYVGMGKELYDNIEVCREAFESADEALGFSISKICFDGPEDDLNSTENTQPAVLTVSIAALKALESHGITADVTAGLSLGEYSALVYSGVLDFKEAVKLVKKRGKYMQEAVPQGIGTMAAIIGLNEESIREVCDECSNIGIVEPANLNCPGQIVIAGEVNAVEAACNKLKEKGALKTVMLAVSGPFHTSMLAPAAEKLETELDNVSINDFKIPVITNVTGDVIEGKEKVKPYLKKQVMSTVLFEKSIKKMMDMGVDTFVEIGPGKALSSFVKKINRKATILNVQDLKSLESTIEKLKS
ncbi:ACP S-malonyltransferase [Clostridiaceae bacterium UIB06]|uniref:Malonyl CoA-acyl carrier protein transacylase n=1 Tax=Clostridium thailandense TaxID=2794346 RepID=A0A949TXB1_9CLOT|nr:ACP S-malonyltransferase [Clostridium thailandense]MBV7273265.1 ACP S-malonyltransferase [Clostridium thailandense]MCH5137290.1 ACP S-malonyltransferase [Clostridiaceae bacterium UIB06]